MFETPWLSISSAAFSIPCFPQSHWGALIPSVCLSPLAERDQLSLSVLIHSSFPSLGYWGICFLPFYESPSVFIRWSGGTGIIRYSLQYRLAICYLLTVLHWAEHSFCPAVPCVRGWLSIIHSARYRSFCCKLLKALFQHGNKRLIRYQKMLYLKKSLQSDRCKGKFLPNSIHNSWNKSVSIWGSLNFHPHLFFFSGKPGQGQLLKHTC